MADGKYILTLNSGSSSLKFALVQDDARAVHGIIDRIGLPGGAFQVFFSEGRPFDERAGFPHHEAALDRLLGWLAESVYEVEAAGHRLVYGGRKYLRPQRIDARLLAALRELIPFAPEHLPHELRAIERLVQTRPDLAQVACFDTSFHSNAPQVARWYPLPREWWERGLMRYGFHGLSFEYLLWALEREGGTHASQGRIVLAHLGSGASMAAIRGGRPLDTTMGLTPSGGLMMGTRTGDLDPGVMLYLVEQAGFDTAAVRELINQRSGLLGVSGSTSDMRELLAREKTDRAAAFAIQLFCYQAKKFLGALAAVLGGMDTLVFAAGVGENAPSIRARICAGMEFLGIRLDPARNAENQAIISAKDSPVTVRVMKTDEELMIARHTLRVVRARAG